MPSTPIPHADLGRGVDQFHPENKLADGYWEQLLNADPTASGSVKKRRGYQRYAGSVPMRVKSVTHSGTSIDLELDESFDLTDLRPTPLIVYGRLSAAQSGDFSTTNAVKYYSTFTVSSGKIRVTDAGAVSASYTDDAPQLTIWGLDWSDDVRADGAGSRWGWVNHLDTYRSALELRPIAGLGGNLFAARTRAEAGAEYSMPLVYPHLRGTVDSEVTIGPVFWEPNSASARTRGYIEVEGASNNWVAVRSAAYDAVTGHVDFVLDCPGLAVQGTLSTIIEVDTDHLSVQGVSGALTGTFLIRAVTQGVDALTLSCTVPGVEDDRYDTSDEHGLAGIFTDLIPMTAAPILDVGDALSSATLDASTNDVTCVGISGTSVVVGGLASLITVPASEVIYAARTSAVLLPRDGSSRTIDDVVRGDVLDVSSLTRRTRVVNINTSADRTIDISGNGLIATATITSGDDTANLAVGDILRVRLGDVFDGDVTITEIPSSTTFTFDHEADAEVTGAQVVGQTIGLDEAIELTDSADEPTELEVHARWVPIEYPAAAASVLALTKVRHFGLLSYSEQNLIRSAMSQDNMYFTDGEHDVMKYDGTNLSRAGLFRWQPALFVNVVKSSTGIANQKSSLAFTAATATTLTVATGDEKLFSSGERVFVHTENPSFEGKDTMVADVSTDTAVRVVDDLSKPAGKSLVTLGTGAIYPVVTLKYYARLNVIDANNNVIASAAAMSSDLTVRFGPRSQVEVTLLRPPVLGLMDVSRIEVELYRTGGTEGAPPFFRISTQALSYSAHAEYIRFIDNTPPSLLLDDSGAPVGELDPTHSVLVGEELGTGWTCPPRAKFITTAGRRLLLANIKSYPTIDIVFRRAASDPVVTASRLLGQTFLLRKETNSNTATNNDDTFLYEFVGGEHATTISARAINNGTDGESFTVDCSATLGAPLPSIVAGSWIYLTRLAGKTYNRYGTSSEYSGWWQVHSVSGTDLTIKKAGEYIRRTISSVDTTNDLIVTTTDHGLVTGDPVYVTVASGGALPSIPGPYGPYARVVDTTTISLHPTYEDAVLGTNILDIATTGSGTLYLNKGEMSRLPNVLVTATAPGDIPVLLDADLAVASSGSTPVESWLFDNNYDMLSGSVRDFAVDAYELIAVRRLANAINASMSKVNPSLYPDFRPWAIAAAGNDFGPGQLVIEAPTASSAVPTCEHAVTGMDVYMNGVKRAASTEVAATTRIFPSRLCRSYPNYLEIFDSPYAQLDSESDSAIDVNPSDGQEITGLIPFYGDSSFGASQKEGVILVFKTASVYVVDIDKKLVQQLETNGQGCTFPRSITPTKYGIEFANEAGIWKINRQMELVFVGKYADRIWRERREKDIDADVPCATHHALDHKYKLSFPSEGAEENDSVLVYDHLRETNPSGEDPEGGLGAWAEYDNHPATWWANVGSDSMFGSTRGLVYSQRRAGDETDYRDDSDAIRMQATYKAVNFGSAGILKAVQAVTVSYRVAARLAGTVVRAAVELVNAFRDLDESDLRPTAEVDKLADLEHAKVRSVEYDVPVRRSDYLQLQFENEARDEPVEITQIDFLVEAQTQKGIEPASQTSRN